ncbi:NACHT domain-containing protein [Mycena sanguinolenta]|uniref:NACHT domain-containing protein n=1 Tax=Mycena sanguinolenta TaxID=230812 RepID=A0A8H6XKU5_9AGAR|nr:NACHT domain-containing protein [Mycena sanguinolenta]
MNNHINGAGPDTLQRGRGGAGGGGYGSGTGGAGGYGMGPSVNFDIRPGGNFTMNNNVRQGERGVDILHRMVALEAIHDSAESYPQPRCHPETRTKMLEDLQEWALAPDPETTILWLHGPAGAGKSAIMQTLARQLQETGRLGGSFFFKRGHATRGNAKTLFATIAYQLALGVPWLKASISQTIENDPSIVARSMKTQMRKLISTPCSPHGYCHPVAVLIDGLDDRPEAHIREMFGSRLYSGHYHSVNVEQSFADVRKYLRSEFSRIHREHRTMAKISLPWPKPDVLDKLVDKSSGHFIYASTIIKFVDDKNYRPTERLAVVQDPNNSGSESVFDTLDQLYMSILSSAPRQSQLIPILSSGLKRAKLGYGLGGLHSVLNVPGPLIGGLHSVYSPSKEIVISSYHASFGDFLSNPDRSGNFCVGTLNRRISLARSLLQFYASPFQLSNICILSDVVHFIVSLPPSRAVAELFPLIGSINPDYIFNPEEYQQAHWYDHFEAMVSWLKNSPLALADVIQLWEDYAFMFSIDRMQELVLIQGPSVQRTVSPSPELLGIVVAIGLLRCRLSELRTKLDLTWTDLRIALCGQQPKFFGDEQVLPIHRRNVGYPWAARDLALQLIRKMVKNHVDTDRGVNPSACREVMLRYDAEWSDRDFKGAYTTIQSASIIPRDNFVDRSNRYHLGCDIAHLVRLCPPCPVLYRELWFIPPTEIWSSRPSGNKLIHHVAKWLKSFPHSTMELITFWQQAVPDPDLCRGSTFNPGLDFEECDWRGRVAHYNYMIVGLHLPNSLKIPS